MNKKVLTILCLVVFLIGAVAMPAFALPDQALPSFDRKVVERIDVENIWEHLEVLADEIGPRVTGTSEERASAEYIAEVLESYGYSVRLDEFALPSRVIVPEVKIVAPFDVKLHPAPLSNTALAPDDGVTAVVMDWGDSMTPPADWEPGMIAFMDAPEGEDRFYYFDDEVDAAIDAGASAVIFKMYDFGEEAFFSNILGGRLSDPVDIPAIILSPMQGEDLRYVLETDEVMINIQLETDKYSQNVVATRTPSNKTRDSGKVLIIGAHYDSVYGSPGANDNASSVVTFMEFARVVANYPIDMELKFIAFGGEEFGFLGAHHYVDSLSEEEKARIAGMINMEMLGSNYAPQEYVFTATVDGSVNFINESMLAAGARLAEFLPPTEPVGFTDHVPFHQAGITAALLARAYPGPIPWDPEGRFGLEPQYHSTYDTLDHMCKERLEQAARILAAAAYDIFRPDTPNLEQSKIRNPEKVPGPPVVVPSR